MSERFTEQERWLTPIPPELGTHAAFLEPISVVEKAVRQISAVQDRLPWRSTRAFVLGVGPVGLLAIALLRLRCIETHTLDMSGPESMKARLIRMMGASHAEAGVVDIRELAARVGAPDLIIESAGLPQLVFDGAQVLAPNGILCVLGGVSGSQTPITFDANEFTGSLVTGNRLILGTVNANEIDFTAGVNSLRSVETQWPGLLTKMVTRTVPMSNFRSALERQRDDIKIVISFSDYSAYRQREVAPVV